MTEVQITAELLDELESKAKAAIASRPPIEIPSTAYAAHMTRFRFVATPDAVSALTAHIRSLTDRLEKAEKEADRLRWLIRRVGVLNDGYSTVWLPSSRTQINANDEAETRSAIDAAIALESRP